jgi:hypothetical protein
MTRQPPSIKVNFVRAFGASARQVAQRGKSLIPIDINSRHLRRIN